MNKYLNLVLVIVIAVIAGLILIKPSTTPNNDQQPLSVSEGEATPMPTIQPSKQYQQAKQVLQENQEYQVVLSTSQGAITIKLDTVNTPKTANNFAFLASEGFYDNTIFHRTIQGFMIQGGDPTGTGTGDPGYKFADEYLQGEYKRGVVAMANSGPDTNGSQFFIMHQDYALPNNYVIFGTVTTGLDVVDKIATAPVQPNSQGEPSSPVEPVTIESATLNEL